MTRFQRRQLLKTTGASAVTLGASSAVPGTPQSETAASTTSHAGVLSTFTQSTQRVTLGIDVDDPTADPATSKRLIEVDTGDTVQGAEGTITVDLFDFDGEILDNGRWRATSRVALDLTNIVLGYDPVTEIQDFLSTLDTDIQNLVSSGTPGEAALSDLLGLLVDPADISADFEVIGAILFGALGELDGFTVTSDRTFTLEDVAALIVPLIDRLDLDQTQADALITLLSLVQSAASLIDNEFLYHPTIDNVSTIITSLGAIVGVPINTFSDIPAAIASLLEQLLGTPDTTVLAMVAAMIGQTGPGIYDILHNSLALDLVPTPQTGDWDPRNGTNPTIGADMTKITLAPAIQLQSTGGSTVGSLASGLPEFHHPIEAHLTSDTSGSLNGSAAVDEQGGTATATLVENETTLALDQLDFAREVERLLDPTDIANLIQGLLGSPDDVDVEQTIIDLEIPGIVEAFDLESDIQDAIRDEPGRHVLSFDFSFSGLDTSADLTNFQDQLPDELPNGRDVPRDLDNDGLFENTDGDGSFDIFDVQTLFLDYQSPVAESNAWAYNFSGDDTSTVTVFDVQGLFEKL